MVSRRMVGFCDLRGKRFVFPEGYKTMVPAELALRAGRRLGCKLCDAFDEDGARPGTCRALRVRLAPVKTTREASALWA
ncbi:hypothetical protein [Synergistes jonesii]|nr:hypothetical protein [Synergistes jonesii]